MIYLSYRSADLVVADFGCGEAVLAQSVPNIVHSFDLVALNERVMACDMAQVCCIISQMHISRNIPGIC